MVTEHLLFLLLFYAVHRSHEFWYMVLLCWIHCVHLFAQVGKVDCVSDLELCASLYIQKPCVAVFKGVGIHDFEIYHGEF